MDGSVSTRSQTVSKNRQRCVKATVSQWGRSPGDFIRVKRLLCSYQRLANILSYLYVGDSPIFEIYDQNMVSVIHDSADVVAQCYCNDNMRIKTSKTKERVICLRKARTFVDSRPHIYVNGNNIERVPQN